MLRTETTSVVSHMDRIENPASREKEEKVNRNGNSEGLRVKGRKELGRLLRLKPRQSKADYKDTSGIKNALIFSILKTCHLI